nr:dynein regulatory complex subunit 6 [Mirounga angustirostris]
MASLRTANPRLRNYFKENYIPQVCEALLCGLLITCPEDPLRYLQKMIITIMENGLESLLWDMCIDPSMRPKIRRLSETYMEQLFGLDDQLMTPELMIKACTFYTGHLVKTHFCTWRDIAIPLINEDELLAEKMEKAMEYDNFRLQKYIFRLWHSYTEGQKKQLTDTLLRMQKMCRHYKLIAILTKWRDKARHKYKKREDELMLKHELQLLKWRSKLKLKVVAKEESIFPEQSASETSLAGKIPECDISLLPERVISRFVGAFTLGVVPQIPVSWNPQHGNKRFHLTSTVPGVVVKTQVAQERRINEHFLRQDFDLVVLQEESGLCRNLQELNVSDCPTLTDESMRYISEGCPGILYLNLSNTTITNRTMRILPRYLVVPDRVGNLKDADMDKKCGQGLMILSRHKKLKELSLSECYKITDVGIQAFCKGSLILEHLDVSYCPQLTDEIIKALAIYCIHLTSLSIAGCPKITDSAMEMLSAKCHYLHILDISGCILLTDQMLEDLQRGCRQLRILKMQYCRCISKEAAKRMSSVVQQQEYNPNDPPLWFGYDYEGKPLKRQHEITSLKGDEEVIVTESTHSSEEVV